jgi:hypothetical protein
VLIKLKSTQVLRDRRHVLGWSFTKVSLVSRNQSNFYLRERSDVQSLCRRLDDFLSSSCTMRNPQIVCRLMCHYVMNHQTHFTLWTQFPSPSFFFPRTIKNEQREPTETSFKRKVSRLRFAKRKMNVCRAQEMS